MTIDESNNPYWQGKLIRLRATEPEDWEHFYLINQERDVDRSLNFVWPPASRVSQKKFTENINASDFGTNWEFKFEIETLDTGEHVGSIDTHHCNIRQGTFEYGLAVREQFRGRGYAPEAILLVLRYYFLELRFQKAEPGVFAFNDSSIRLHEKLGFVLEGRKRSHGFSNGQRHDLLLYGMIAEEFTQLHPDYANL